jgi:hypothetical protein
MSRIPWPTRVSKEAGEVITDQVVSDRNTSLRKEVDLESVTSAL